MTESSRGVAGAVTTNPLLPAVLLALYVGQDGPLPAQNVCAADMSNSMWREAIINFSQRLCFETRNSQNIIWEFPMILEL